MKYVLASSLVILIIFLAVLSMIPKGIEPLTELYFENHTLLPKYIFPNHDYNFSFTIHNIEYTDMDYNYTINALNNSGAVIYKISEGKFSLANNKSKTIFKKFKLPKYFGRAEINIQLNKITSGGKINAERRFWWPDPNYPNKIDIHFWVEEIM